MVMIAQSSKYHTLWPWHLNSKRLENPKLMSLEWNFYKDEIQLFAIYERLV